MNTKTKILAVSIAGVSTLVILGGVATATTYAATANYPSIVTTLAEKFNLDPAAVAQVFTDEHEARQDEHLDRLVTDGKLTQAQRDALEAKQDELHTKMQAIRDSDATETEKRTQIRALHDDMQQWLKDQGIEDLREFGMGRGGPRGGMMRGL